MAVFLDKNGLIPALKQMSGPPVPFVEELCVNAIQLPHSNRQIAIRSFNKEVIVVGHEAVSMTDPII
jgi:hypothetical protein